MAGEQLRVTEGKADGKDLTVEAELLIGRAAAQDEGKLGDDPEISRRHARVSRGADGQLMIEDLGSANGTFVNDERIDAPRPLVPGDLVRMGQTVLQVTDASGEVHEATRLQPAAAAEQATSVAAPAGEQLVVTEGTDKGRRLALEEDLVIGREVSGEGKLEDDLEVSRRHARVSRDAGGGLTIEDLGSANGTFVNGAAVRGRQALKVGDSVRVGGTTMQLTEAGAAPAPAPAPQAAPPAAAPKPAPPPPAPKPAPPPRAAPKPAPPPAPKPAPPPQAAPKPAAPPPAPKPAAPPPAPKPAAPRPAPEGAPLTSVELTLGSVFAGCRVEEVIGRGDMGVVYRAEQLNLERPVALKLILEEHSRESRFRERFHRESMVAAAIDHQNVIPILEAGDENGILFITMRLVEGTDLRELIAAEGALDSLRAARIVRQVGAALDAAHARGLMHRDVKPANVLLARRDHVYLSDFGLAKRADEEGGLTRPGSLVARVEYVSPEQIKNERVDARADVYALGCLLYEALTGAQPFAERRGGQAMMAHLEAPPPSPTERRPDLPREFDEVVRRAMAKDPGERYPSAGDLGQAALVAAGGQRRTGEESVVATGEAAPGAPGARAARPPAAAASTPAPPPAPRPASAAGADGGAEAGRGRSSGMQWGIAIAALVILVVLVVVALGALSK